jgi:hypothetical protein
VKNSLFQYVWNPLKKGATTLSVPLFRAVMCSSCYTSKAAIYLEMGEETERLFSAAFTCTQYRDIPYSFLRRSKLTVKLDMYSIVTKVFRFPRQVSHKYSGLLHYVVSFRNFEECAASIYTVTELPSGGYLKLI